MRTNQTRAILTTLALAAAAPAVRATPIQAADYGVAPGKPFTAEDVARLLQAVRQAPPPAAPTA